MAIDTSGNAGARVTFDGLAAPNNKMSFQTWILPVSWDPVQADGTFPSIGELHDGSVDDWLFNISKSGSNYFLHYVRTFSTTNGIWTVPAPSLALHAIQISYDASAVGNNPTILVDGISQTVTRVTAPVGTARVSGTKYSFGSFGCGVATGGGTFRGKNQDPRIYNNRILTASEWAALAASSRTIEMNDNGLTFHAPLMYAANRYPAIPFAGTLGATDYTYDRIGGVQGTPAGSPSGAADMVYGTGF